MQDLIDWIIGQGISSRDVQEIMEGLAPRLVALGYPIVRSSIAMPSIDPMQKGFSVAWSPGSGLSIDIQGHGDAGQEMFERSPIFHLLSKGLLDGRWSLPTEKTDSFPLFDELVHLGATDYLIRLAEFPGETALGGIGFSLAIDGPHGFSDQQIAAIDQFMPALALACYRVATTRIATDLLAVYTGARTSGRILSGQTRRGEGTAIYAAILLADLKDFTSLNERWPPEKIVGWLNEHFDAIAGPVEENGGEVLKFMGDSLLAIFPADLEDPSQACDLAFSSARMAMKANQALNARRAALSEPQLLVDVVLHVGQVFYGNIGASRRLDFTAIGRAVNEAARMEKIADTVGYSLLASAPFAAQLPVGFESMGSFVLKGVSKPAEVFAWTA
ncbi:adenylate/guanylate cyclase domain-containing protein [Rhizobium sp. Root1220]|uniref:adenylate/guanylate cyclase domain-containing protein n=1 Tax=Rhizobium sp. Root1220 TaxID=1736432 RepID=UPI0006FD0870|nr:adenylate/guanylate cyclase domain-containing protein [Rhizobium sp. Root1220]KQV83168.1 adenylate cyclase [Rhizobium sp. Root1220]